MNTIPRARVLSRTQKMSVNTDEIDTTVDNDRDHDHDHRSQESTPLLSNTEAGAKK
jgi:hypothetical protein